MTSKPNPLDYRLSNPGEFKQHLLRGAVEMFEIRRNWESIDDYNFCFYKLLNNDATFQECPLKDPDVYWCCAYGPNKNPEHKDTWSYITQNYLLIRQKRYELWFKLKSTIEQTTEIANTTVKP